MPEPSTRAISISVRSVALSRRSGGSDEEFRKSSGRTVTLTAARFFTLTLTHEQGPSHDKELRADECWCLAGRGVRTDRADGTGGCLGTCQYHATRVQTGR